MGAHDQAIAAAQRTLALATAKGMSSCRPWRIVPSAEPTRPRATIVRRSTASGRPGVLRRGAAPYERFGQTILPAVHSRPYFAGCHAELGTFAAGSTFGDEGLRIAEAGCPPREPHVCLLGVGLLALRQGDLPGALPRLERAVGICQDGPPGLVPRIAPALGYSIHPGLARRRRRAAARSRRWNRATARRLPQGTPLARPGGGAGVGWLPGGGTTLRRAALALAREHQERGHEAYALRLLGEIAARREPPESDPGRKHYYHQALALAEDLGMRPLQAYCHLGLGTLYWSDGPAAAGPHRAVCRHRPIPCHGHDLLAAPGTGSAGAGGRTVSGFMQYSSASKRLRQQTSQAGCHVSLFSSTCRKKPSKDISSQGW